MAGFTDSGFTSSGFVTDAVAAPVTYEVTEPIGITESVTTAMTVWFTTDTEQIGITEATTSMLHIQVAPPNLAPDFSPSEDFSPNDDFYNAGTGIFSDTVKITESVHSVTETVTQHLTVDITESIGITESVTVSMSIWLTPTPTIEQVGITEATTSMLQMS